MFGVPIVHSTINVRTGRGKPTLPSLAGVLADSPIDRTTTNAWEDPDFLSAVCATGRCKLIICALWTEFCMAFRALDAMREGYEVYPVVDAIGGTSVEAMVELAERWRPYRSLAVSYLSASEFET